MRYHFGVNCLPAFLLAALLLGWPAGAGPAKQKIFKPDDRFPVLDTAAWPWRVACRVYSIFPDDLAAVGSGILVGPRHVLTAGHVVYDDLDGGRADFVEVAPGYEYGYAPYGYARAVDIKVFRGWEENEDFDYDLALITLNRNIGDGVASGRRPDGRVAPLPRGDDRRLPGGPRRNGGHVRRPRADR